MRSTKYEIAGKDVMGRILRISTPHGRIESPALLPVINPNIPFITPREMRKMGAEAVITNAYILYRTKRDEVLEKGLHDFLDCDLPVMTDSGSYQLLVYGDVEVGNREIVEFQCEIGSDIIVPLDVPTPPDADRGTAERDLEETVRREKEAAEIVDGRENLLSLPVQGSTHYDLRRKSAEIARGIGGDVYPIGGVVPLMDAYRFVELAKIVLEVRSVLKVEPIHLFGCGHPMLFALAVALGCDLFDSAAYVLYAKDDRYLTVYGTKKLEDLNYFPCSCPVCINSTPDEVRKMEKREREMLLAKHNLYVSFQEIRAVKQTIKENSLFELVERRIRSHPYLLAAWRQIREYSTLVEEFDPKIKRRFLYCGVESVYRPAVGRHIKQLSRVDFGKKHLVVSSDFGVKADLYLRPVFGPVAAEMLEVYPAGHAEMPDEDSIEDEAVEKAVENFLNFAKLREDCTFEIKVSGRWFEFLRDVELPPNCRIGEDVA